jgi:hypothetical protein
LLPEGHVPDRASAAIGRAPAPAEVRDLCPGSCGSEDPDLFHGLWLRPVDASHLDANGGWLLGHTPGFFGNPDIEQAGSFEAAIQAARTSQVQPCGHLLRAAFDLWLGPEETSQCLALNELDKEEDGCEA